MRRTRFHFVFALLVALAPSVALAIVDLDNASGLLFDVQEATDYEPGSLSDGGGDAYDDCYGLRVGDIDYAPSGASVLSMAGRQVELPAATMVGLSVRRLVYVSDTADYARYLEVLDNPGATDITTTVEIYGNLGSDFGTIVPGTSSGDATVGLDDLWFATDDFDAGGDPSLAHVFSGEAPTVTPTSVSLETDNIDYEWSVTVPAGGRVVIMHFAIQANDEATALADARALEPPPDDALAGADDYLSDVVNWDVGFPTAPCVGLSEGDACTTDRGSSGLCRATRCCTGCFDGTMCRSGRTASECGVGGAMCASCVDGDACSTDVCTDGLCSNPDAPVGTRCDDGTFCTSIDRCDGAGTCVGSGDPCNDLQSCTTDICDETMDHCSHAGLADLTSCTGSAGTSGVCHSAACCAGCWNGTACLPGTGASACGVGGGACASCVDGDACTSDVCSAGVCSNPFAPSGTHCDDGMFCTATDRCDGAGNCGGSGNACDDHSTCTMDSCDESADSCTHAVSSGCVIGGECVAMGAINRTYPCQICDPTVNDHDWSPVVPGTPCGPATCSAGHLTQRACDASGACMGTRVACPGGGCADATTCGTGCSAGSCGAGQHCDTSTGMCVALHGNGEACTDPSGCQSGLCVDGVCCSSACSGTCEACDMLGSIGSCQPIPSGNDPDGECETSCNGARGCLGSSEDAGTPVADAGVRPDAGSGDDAAVQRGDGGAGIDGGAAAPKAGCSCRAAGSTGSRAPFALALPLLALLWRRRRSR